MARRRKGTRAEARTAEMARQQKAGKEKRIEWVNGDINTKQGS